MTPASSRPGKEPQQPELEPASRRLAALVTGGFSGACGFALVIGAGFLLYQRLWAGSTPILIAVLVGSAVIGAYAGWLLGVLVFSAARGDVE